MPGLQLRFNGNLEPKSGRPHRLAPPRPKAYRPTPELVEAVNLALYLQRPLLIEGEAGCGKTMLALALAYELGLPLFPWIINSTSRLQDGLYTSHSPTQPGEALEVVLGPVGKAYSVKSSPAVLLIDEIDRAYDAFPSDLLTVLKSPWEFEIPETGRVVKAFHPPVVVLTNNQTKNNLNESFLRLCVYCFVEFPGNEELLRIVEAHFPGEFQAEFTNAVIDRFLKIRVQSRRLQKPGVQELLDWIRVLRHNPDNKGVSAADVENANVPPYHYVILNAATSGRIETGARLLSPRALAQLADRLSESFNKEELQELCDSLDIPSSEMPPDDTLRATARALAEYMNRRRRIPELISQLERERDKVGWTEFL